MVFREEERRNVEEVMASFMERRRPPERVRDQVDLDYSVERQSIVIFERRADWMLPEDWVESPVAKATYVRTQDVWRLYWLRSDLQWHGYDPAPEFESLDVLLEVVDKDPLGCFWG